MGADRSVSAPAGGMRPDAFALGALLLYAGFLVTLVVSNIGYISPSAFAAVWRSADLRYAIRISLVTSTITALLSLAVAIPAGYALSRYRFPGVRLLDTIADIPIILPHLVIGLMLLVFFQTAPGRFIESAGLRFVYTPAGIVLAQFTVASAFAVRAMKAAFDGLDPRLESVARTLGWSRRQAFLRTTLPAARNGVLAAAIFAWAQAIGLFGPLMIFAGTTRRRTEVMATAIYLELSVGHIETALAIALVMIAFAFAALALVKRLVGGGGYGW
jgi:molybdate transport system permease protein